MLILLCGVSGSGKTTIGRLLAARLRCRFIDADDFHPAANRAKMSRGEPLEDSDREEWLDALHARLIAASKDGEALVLACSALKAIYRERLAEGLATPLRILFLRADAQLLRQRLKQRDDHFFPAGLLDSQMAALEVPDEALVLDASEAPEVIVDCAAGHLAPDPK